MKREIIVKLRGDFEAAVQKRDDVEFWYARDLQVLLGYEKWENFIKVIKKAKSACLNSRQPVEDHFPDVGKMVDLGSGAQRSVDDIMLTRAREKLSSSERQLSGVLFERGVDHQGFARIRSKGDAALFGGYTTQKMKEKLGVPEKRPLADFLPTITIKAKDFANEITQFNVTRDNLHGEAPIASEHVKNNQEVRGLLAKRSIKPENLPPAEDIKKIERKVSSETRKLPKAVKRMKP